MNATMQYFVGEFDGEKFINENEAAVVFRPDYGPEYYAAISFNQLPASQLPTAIGWVNNWNYANDIPTTPWKGAMTLPRTMRVKKIGHQWILVQQPVAAIQQLRQPLLLQLNNKNIDGVTTVQARSAQCEITLQMEPAAGGNSGLRIATGNGHYVEIGYDAAKQELYIDRSKTAEQAFNKNFEKQSRYAVPLQLTNKMLKLQVYLDHSIAEVFVNDGEAVFTMQFFPGATETGMALFSEGGKSKLLQLQVWPMKSIW
jgi:fructan beta-fructosidase